jgi:SPP1 family predicted phage head-tail adaptor
MPKRKLNIGDLNRRIEIQEETATRGTSGQEILTWAQLACVWALVDYPATGSGESIEGNQVVVSTRVDFVIRYRDGLDEKMRIVYRGSNYGIININEHETRNEFLRLKAMKIE